VNPNASFPSDGPPTTRPRVVHAQVVHHHRGIAANPPATSAPRQYSRRVRSSAFIEPFVFLVAVAVKFVEMLIDAN